MVVVVVIAAAATVVLVVIESGRWHPRPSRDSHFGSVEKKEEEGVEEVTLRRGEGGGGEGKEKEYKEEEEVEEFGGG